MAIVKLVDPNSVGSWNRTMMFPKNRYAVRCLEEDFGPSGSGNPMITRKFEIVQTAPVQIGDKLVDIDGLQMTAYRVVKVSDGNGGWDKEKTDKCLAGLRDDLQKAGYTEESFDDENPPLVFKGKVFDAIVYGKESKMFKEATAEQRQKGQKVGDPIQDANGKDIVTYQLQIEMILGPSTAETNRPY